MVRLLPTVEILRLPWELLQILVSLSEAARMTGESPIITGVQGESYPPGRVHDAGYAVDVRKSNLSSVDGFVRALRERLCSLPQGSRYLVLSEDEEHRDHMHVGFAWFWSIEPKH